MLQFSNSHLEEQRRSTVNSKVSQIVSIIKHCSAIAQAQVTESSCNYNQYTVCSIVEYEKNKHVEGVGVENSNE